MSGLLSSGPFVAVFPSLVRSLGSMEAAAIVQYVAYRQTSDEPIRLRVADFCEATGLSETTVKRHTRALAESGVLVKHQAGRNAVVAYAVVRDHEALRGSDRSPGGATSAPSGAGSPSTSRVRTQEPADGGMLPIIVSAAPSSPPVNTGPPKTAQTLVARWCDGFRASNAGADAPGPIMKRVAGQAKTLAKNCETDADWSAAWRAAYAAGEHGRPDPVPFMVAARSQYQSNARRNVFAEPALGGPGAEVMGRFQSMLAGDQTRALGASS